MNSLRPLVLVALATGLAAPVLATDKYDLGVTKSGDEITPSVGELADITLQGDEIGNPFVVSSLSPAYVIDVPDISIFNNVYTSTNSSNLRPGDDVVFSFTPTVTQTGCSIDLSASYTYSSSVDTYLHVFRGSVSNATRVAYDDDNGAGNTSMLTGLTFTAGETYYIIIETYSATTGPWHIGGTISGPCVDPGYPAGYNALLELEPVCIAANNTCVTAEPLPVNTGLGGLTKADGTKDTDWFTFTTAGLQDVSLTLVSNCVPMVATLYGGTCASTTYKTSVTGTPNTTVVSTIQSDLPAGTYFVKVEPNVTTGFACAGNYTYGLKVNSASPPPPPANDLPADAIAIAIGDCVTGSTTRATDNTGAYADTTHLACHWLDYYSATSSGSSADVFYVIELPCETEYSFSMLGSTYDTVLGIWDASGNLVAGNDDNPGIEQGSYSVIECCVLPAGTYLISVDGYGSGKGNYSLCVTQCEPCPVVSTDDQPMGFQLRQNFPNPFNPVTTISFTLNELSTASLKVFDMAGREVATLVSGELERGEHNVVFDGSQLSSGLYVYTLTANGHSLSQKMVLMK